MVQTIIVYLFLLLCMVFLVSPRVKLRVTISSRFFRSYNLSIMIALLIFAIIFGMRYGVGVDHLGYLRNYVQFQNEGKYWVFNNLEVGFGMISKLFGELGIHYWVYFAFWSFLQAFFLFYALKRNQESILPFLAITFILGGTALSFMNGIRQQLAFCIFVFSIEFIKNHKPLKYYILILLASFFHFSALILLPIYPLIRFRKKPYFNRIWLQFILLGISLFLLYLNFIEEIFFGLSKIITFFGYGRYMDILSLGKEHLLFSLTRSRGIGFYIIVLLNIILIASSNKLKDYFSNGYFSKIYDLYFIGVIYGYICNGSIVLLRPNYYFGGFTFIVAAYTLLFFYKHQKGSRNNILLFITLMSLYLLLFAAIIYRMDENTYRFIFFWQEHLFHLKNF